jgi:hypothetical protein
MYIHEFIGVVYENGLSNMCNIAHVKIVKSSNF